MCSAEISAEDIKVAGNVIEKLKKR